MKLLCIQIPGAGEQRGPHTTAGFFEGFYGENHQPNSKVKTAGRKSDYMWSSPGGNDFKKPMVKKDLFPHEYDAGLELPDICHFDMFMVSRAV